MKAATLIFALTLMFNCASCNPADNEIPEAPGNNGPGPGDPGGNNDGNMKIHLTIGSRTFTATLEESAASAAFMKMLPLTLDMADVNRNEKYIQLGNSLPTSASNPGTIRTGDLMLWGSNGLVLFYKTFTTSYSYTRLGAVDDVEGLEAALGSGNVVVTFRQVED